MAKAFAKAFYSSKAWQDCRNEYMTKVHHLCEECLSDGIYKPADIVHHVVELTPANINCPEITLNHNNLQAVCRDCHGAKHDIKNRWSGTNEKKRQAKKEKQRYKLDEYGRATSR